MEKRITQLAEEVIGQADRQHPADALLRATLKRAGARPELGRAVTRVVFAYYRWLRWLPANQGLVEQLIQARELDARYARQPEIFSDDELRQAVPDWTPGQMDYSPEWLRALQQAPRLWLRARPGQAGALAKALGAPSQTRPGPLADALEYLGTEDLFRTPQFHTGAMELQDINSQAVAWMCDPQPGETWWDACAGEGGKTLHLSDRMQNQGMIWATDRAAWRLARLKRRAARARVFNYRAAAWDGAARLPTKTKFDGVLVDAPCSGLGTWQRNPHARWTTTPEDIQELSQLQLDLLVHAAAAVKPGGKLIYAVCTLTFSETLEVAAAFRQRLPDWQPLSLINPFTPSQPPAPQWSFWPQHHGGNGMFVAAWKK